MAKFCSKCGTKLDDNATKCSACGAATETEKQQGQPIIVNVENKNANYNANNAGVPGGRVKNKWIALLFWFFLGIVGGHKFYEGRIGMGVLYLFTAGLFGIGLFIDFWALLFKPTHYYV